MTRPVQAACGMKRSGGGDARLVRRWVALAAWLAAAIAAPSAAHATGYGGGARDLGIVLQPRGDRMAVRFDTSAPCRTVGRGTVALDYWRFSGRGGSGQRRWRLRGQLREGSISGRLRVAGCGAWRFRASAWRGPDAEAMRPRRGGWYGGMSTFLVGDGMLAPLQLRVSRDRRSISGRLTLTGSCRGVPGALSIGPLPIRRDRTFDGSRTVRLRGGGPGRLWIAGRIAADAAVGLVRVRGGGCDTGKRRWGAGRLRFIRKDEPVSPFGFELAEEPPYRWPMTGSWSLEMTSDAGSPPDYIGLGGSYSFRSPRGTLWMSGGGDHFASFMLDPTGASRWGGDFAAPWGTTLGTRVYEEARRAPFHEGSEPGMDVSGDHRGCNDIRGRFTIHRLARAPDGFLRMLHVTFEQHCEFEEPALRGEFRFSAR